VTVETFSGWSERKSLRKDRPGNWKSNSAGFCRQSVSTNRGARVSGTCEDSLLDHALVPPQASPHRRVLRTCQTILLQRERIKLDTIKQRGLQHRRQSGLKYLMTDSTISHILLHARPIEVGLPLEICHHAVLIETRMLSKPAQI